MDKSLLKYFLNTRFLFLAQDQQKIDELKKITSQLILDNVFNPSFYCEGDLNIFAFRAIPKSAKALLSYVSIKDRNGHIVKNISEDWSKVLGCPRLIDPKVFKLNGDIYLTFNSGFVPKGNGNDIFVMKIYPVIEPPKRIIYERRQKQERNWAFFCKNGEIYALYWINPLRILKLKLVDDSTWTFEDWYEGEKNDVILEELTIGTQLVFVKDRYYFVAHKKLIVKGKKLYLGRMLSLNLEQKTITAGKYWLAHSPLSLFGSMVKHNQNLFSCTYFSGLQVVGDDIQLGYGINDITYGLTTQKIRSLFSPLDLKC